MTQTEEEIIKDHKTTAVATVILPKDRTTHTLFARDRLNTPSGSYVLYDDESEAKRANKNGTTVYPKKYPGIPSSKFTHSDVGQYGQGAEFNYTVQNVFECKDDPTLCRVQFEGWTSLYTQPLKPTVKNLDSVFALARFRAAFLEKIHQDAIENRKRTVMTPLIEKFRYPKSRDEYGDDANFWMYQDLSHYHTGMQEEQMLAPVMYMSVVEDVNVPPPKYLYSALNIMEILIYKAVTDSKACWTFKEMNKIRRLGRRPGIGCKNMSGCVCQSIYDLLYKYLDRQEQDIQLLGFNDDGTLILDGLDTNKRRLVIECSNQCGCDSTCPRRAMQKGNQTPIVVYHEGSKKGFGCRGAKYKKGQYIGEYTGKMFFYQKGQNTSYQVGFEVLGQDIGGDLVICAKDVGNYTRFFSHSCKPNAFFVETYSRRFETDPLIPRIAVYALEDIPFTDEICIAYWTKEQLATMKKSNIDCQCGHKDVCCGKLPYS